jgi:predicted ATPase
VESHSEHLLRRLQRRVAEGKIEHSDVALYVVQQTTLGSSRLERLEVDRYGDILNWPRNFFGDELQDVAVQAELGLQKRLNAQ